MAKRDPIIKERTSLRAILAGVVIFLAGAALLWIASVVERQWAQAILNGLGGALAAAASVTLLWELAVKRAFLAEAMELARLGTEVTSAGVVDLTSDFLRGVEWTRLIDESSEADVLLSYGRTWRNANLAPLRSFAERGRLRLALPDPEHAPTVNDLAGRFSMAPDEVRAEIRNTVKDFRSLFEAVGRADQADIRFHQRGIAFSYYRLGNQMVVALYKHQQKKVSDIPTFVVRGGTFGAFLARDFDDLFESAMRAT